MTIASKSLTVFFRDQGIYLFIAFVVGAIFWAIGQPVNPFTVIWLIFLTVLGVVMLPVYALSTAWKYSGDSR
jgi:hypothetical protein